jgi:hypothetical protein
MLLLRLFFLYLHYLLQNLTYFFNYFGICIDNLIDNKNIFTLMLSVYKRLRVIQIVIIVIFTRQEYTKSVIISTVEIGFIFKDPLIQFNQSTHLKY